MDALRILKRCFRKLGPNQGHVMVATCTTSGLGRDNFIGIKTDDFQNFPFIFTSPMEIDCIIIPISYVSESK